MEQKLLKTGADSLKKAALNEDAKEFILKNDTIFKVLKKAANRYIGGESTNEALKTVREWNNKGFDVTTDFMGESIRNEKDANKATAEFVQFAKAIKRKNLNSSISLDLSHIGLLVSNDLATENLRIICNEAQKMNQEVIISMEGTDRTDRILDIYVETLKSYKNLGITMQAYLHRTKDDFKEVAKLSGSIRMVKGAYETPDGLSIKRGSELDQIYLDYVEQLLSQNHRCSIASHHEKIHQESIKLIKKLKPTNYVLERLLGIRNEELIEYKGKGLNCRIYIVYGKEWYLYLCNRWAEYPLSMFQGIADIVEEK